MNKKGIKCFASLRDLGDIDLSDIRMNVSVARVFFFTDEQKHGWKCVKVKRTVGMLPF